MRRQKSKHSSNIHRLPIFFGPLSASVAACLISTITATPTKAEDSEQANPPSGALQASAQLEEIIVTGEKRRLSLFDTTTSVAVTTGADIEARNIQGLQDILLQTPNVNQQNGGEGFAIRGVNSDSVTGAGSGPLATLYIDGAQIHDLAVRAGQLDLWDIAQVEIFRGAQSLIQGRNSLAGSIHIRSNDPSYDFESKGRIQYAEYGTYVASAALNLPLIDQSLAIRLGIDYKESDGFINNPTRGVDDYDGNQNLLLRGKILFEPQSLPDFRALLTLSYSDNEAGDDVVDAAHIRTRSVFSNLPARENLDQFIATLELDYALNDIWHLASVSSYNEADYDRFDDDDQSAFGGDNSRRELTGVDTFSQELRLAYEGARLHGHFGFFFLDEQQKGQSVFSSGISIPALLPPAFQPVGPFIAPFYPDPFLTNSTGRDQRSTQNYAGFFDFDYDISNLITLHAGLRYDREYQDNDIVTTLAFGSDLPDLAAIPALPVTPELGLADVVGLINGLLLSSLENRTLVSTTRYDAWLPKFGITFNWSDDLATSFLVQRGYRAGGAGVSTLTGVFEFNPEYTWTYEGVIRANLLDGRAQWRTNIFYTDWRDQQVLLEANPADFIVTNAGKSEYYGLESQIDLQLNEGLKTYLGLGYVKTKFKDFISPQGDFSGNEFANAPHWSFNAGATYHHETGFFAEANLNYQSDSFDQSVNELENDARTVVNARIGYDFTTISLSLFARNLFDERYITRNQSRNAVVKLGDPQVFGAEISFKF